MNNLGDHIIDPSEKRGGTILQLSSDIDLKNMDIDGFSDEAAVEEEILKLILEQSRRDFEELELKNKQNPNDNNTNNNKVKYNNINNINSFNIVENANNFYRDYENLQNLVYDESGDYEEGFKKDSYKQKIKESLVGFLNRQASEDYF